MATTYNIYFTNNSGLQQNYAFFSAPPVVDSSIQSSSVYSNAWITKTLVNGQNFNVAVTKTFYAWCGTSPQTLAPGVTTSTGMALPATLGSVSSPGSTFALTNNGGSPVFATTPPPPWTADAGCYEIDADSSFTTNMNFLMGLSAPDSSGRMVPLASFAAPPNAAVNIQPVVKYWVGAYNATTGSAINYSSATKNAGLIDFVSNPGMFGAIVSQGSNGAFSVQYTASASDHSAAIAASQQDSPAPSVAQQIQDIKRQLRALERSVSPVQGATGTRFLCPLNWRGESPNRGAIATAIETNIQASGDYTVFNKVEKDNGLTYTITAARQSAAEMQTAWDQAWGQLSPNYRSLSATGNCTLIGANAQSARGKAEALTTAPEDDDDGLESGKLVRARA